MKKRLCLLILCLCMGLSSCASMLERSYEVSVPHMDKPALAEDSSILQVNDYRELVSAVLYLVSQREERGTIRMVDYKGDVEADLTAACLEVATEDPLGAYCVDYIKHESVRVVSYDQADLSIRYRRSAEQVDSMVNVTGTSAIRAELHEALSRFQTEVVLRIAYFAGDADSIGQLIRQAYYDAPLYAQGMPETEILLYPESGRERVVEILLTYPGEVEELRDRSARLADWAETMPGIEPGLQEDGIPLHLAQSIRRLSAYDPEGGSTPYAALLEGCADDQGLALAYLLVCQEEGIPCEVVEGTLAPETETGEETSPQRRFWNVLTLNGAQTYLDLSAEEPALRTAAEMAEAGYDWPGAPAPETAEPEAGG